MRLMSSSRSSRIGRELIWVGIGQLAAALGGIVGIRLLTHLMSPQSYGQLALGMTVATLAQQTTFAGVSGASLRFYSPALEKRQLLPFLRATWILLRQRTIFMGAQVVALVGVLWVIGGRRWVWLALAATAFALLSSYEQALDGMQNAARQRAVVAWHQGLGQWLRFLLAVLFVGAFGSSSTSAMCGFAAALAVVLTSQIVFFRMVILRSSPDEGPVAHPQVSSWSSQMRSYAAPFPIWGVFCWMQITSDRWALQTFGHTSDVGLYAVLYQLGYYPVSMLAALMVQLITPVLFNCAGDGTDKQRTAAAHRTNFRLLGGTMGITVAATLCAWLLHRPIFWLVVAPGYRSVSGFLPLMVLAGGLFACGQIATLVLLSRGDTQALLAPKIGTAILGLALNVAGAYWGGVQGVVWANVVFGASFLLWILGLARVRSLASAASAGLDRVGSRT